MEAREKLSSILYQTISKYFNVDMQVVCHVKQILLCAKNRFCRYLGNCIRYLGIVTRGRETEATTYTIQPVVMLATLCTQE